MSTANYLFIGIATIFFGGIGYWIFLKYVRAVDGWFRRFEPAGDFRELDLILEQKFSKNTLERSDYDFLVSYFAFGASLYRDTHGSRINYPGAPGSRGLKVEGLEGFARISPLLASWSVNTSNEIMLPNGAVLDIDDFLLRGIAAGTDPNSPGYWGDISDYDQRIVEAGDIAITAWILRDKIQDRFSQQQVKHLTVWLGMTYDRKIYGGNWHLFPLACALVCEHFGVTAPPGIIDKNREAIKHLYLGDGWFDEGYSGIPDLYNAWQFPYYFFFFDQICKAPFETVFTNSVHQMSETFHYFFSAEGFPFWGRSACYRLALPSPLIADLAMRTSEKHRFDERLGIAKRSLDATWGHFIRNGAVKNGLPTQGYYGENTALLENYSGRGSSLWSLRSLTLAIWLDKKSGVLSLPSIALPVENSDFTIHLEKPGITISGYSDDDLVQVHFAKNATEGNKGIFEEDSLRTPVLQRLLENLAQRPLRPSNLKSKYLQPVYSNKRSM